MKAGKAELKDYIYARGMDSVKDADFSAAKPYGKVMLGSGSIFWKKGLRWYCADFAQTVRIFRRIAEVNAKLCCGNSNFDIQMLVLVMFDGRELELIIGDSLLRHEAEALYAAVQAAHPELHYGKPE